MVIFPVRGTYNHVTIFFYQERKKAFNEVNLAKVNSFDKILSRQRNIYTWLYEPLTGYITIWHILGKNKSMRSEPQDIGLAFDVFTSKLPCLISFDLATLFLKQMLLKELTQAKLVS